MVGKNPWKQALKKGKPSFNLYTGALWNTGLHGMFLSAALLVFAWGCAKAPASYPMPLTVDPSTRFLFYLHGAIVEEKGAHATHPVYGTYDYHGIIKAFADRGFRVISEIRPVRTDIRDYAEKTAGQIRTLLASGVPAENVIVAGFSKGGAITLYVSSLLGEPQVKFVVMAGCGRKGSFRRAYEKFLREAAPSMRGRVLSLYDESDEIGGTCMRAFEAASSHVIAEEILLHAGKGHGTFYRPRKEWIDPAVQWILR